LQRTSKIVSFLDEKKAENIEVFDMKGSGYFVDEVIIATILNEKHGIALVDYLKPFLKKLGEKNILVDASDEWSVLDLGDMIIHLMSSDYRTKYNIEELLDDILNNVNPV